MPELPDVSVYVERLNARLVGERLERIRIQRPFLLRTVDPPVTEVEGKRVLGFRRLGKRIVAQIEGELFLVIHLMIAGRLRWKKPGAAIPKGSGLATFDFPSGAVLFTEASKKKRASLHVVRGEAGLAQFNRGGLEVLESDLAAFSKALLRDNHTLKRALTDQSIVSGIGNAYSDEILHCARLSPFKQTRALSGDELERLYRAAVNTLTHWTDRLRAQVGEGFPEKVTAFHEAMAVHGKYGKPCPVCGAPVQRIVYAENECNYCPGCQTEGKILADRALSRLLKRNWPRTLEELESGAARKR